MFHCLISFAQPILNSNVIKDPLFLFKITGKEFWGTPINSGFPSIYFIDPNLCNITNQLPFINESNAQDTVENACGLENLYPAYLLVKNQGFFSIFYNENTEVEGNNITVFNTLYKLAGNLLTYKDIPAWLGIKNLSDCTGFNDDHLFRLQTNISYWELPSITPANALVSEEVSSNFDLNLFTLIGFCLCALAVMFGINIFCKSKNSVSEDVDLIEGRFEEDQL